MELVPYTEKRRDTIADIDFGIPNPNYEEELASLRAAREHNPFAVDDVRPTWSAALTEDASNLVDGNEVVVEASEVILVVGYPFSGQYATTIQAASPSGFTRAELFRYIVTAIETMYAGATYEPTAIRFNTRVTSPDFGTALHVITDLALEAVFLERRRDGKLVAWALIGS